MDEHEHAERHIAACIADDAARIAQYCAEAAAAIGSAASRAGSAAETGEEQRAMRSRAAAVLRELHALVEMASRHADSAALDAQLHGATVASKAAAKHAEYVRERLVFVTNKWGE